MAKKTLHLKRKQPVVPEHAVRTVPENTARALTPAEAYARQTLQAIAAAEAQAEKERQ